MVENLLLVKLLESLKFIYATKPRAFEQSKTWHIQTPTTTYLVLPKPGVSQLEPNRRFRRL